MQRMQPRIEASRLTTARLTTVVAALFFVILPGSTLDGQSGGAMRRLTRAALEDKIRGVGPGR